MIPVQKAYRTAIFEALDGNITYDGDIIPVVTAISEPTGPYYIVLDSITGNQVGTDKLKFGAEPTITIEIADYQTRAASYVAVNDIYALVLAILIPQTFKAGFTMASPFQAECPEIVSDDEVFEQPFEKVVRKIFRLRSKIVQNS